MSESKVPPTPFVSLMNGSGGLPDAGARTAAFWTAQAAAAEHVRAFVDEWWERRRQAAADAADCCATLFADGADPSASAEAWSAWARGALERLSEDARAQTALAGSLAGDAVSALNATADESEPHDDEAGETAAARREDVR